MQPQMNLPKNLLVRAALVYVTAFILTIPIWWFALPKKNLIASNLFCAAVNSIFVQHLGYVWFTVAYVGHCFNFADASDVVPKRNVIRQLFKYSLNTGCWFLVNFWFLGPLLVERLNVATGGHCASKDLKPVSLGMQQCRNSTENVWLDGFDMLGHYYFLLTLSLLILHNGIHLPAGSELKHQGPRSKAVLTFIRALSAWLLTVWFLEYCVTSMFFHTVGERFAGLVGIPVAFAVIYIDQRVYPEIIE